MSKSEDSRIGYYVERITQKAEGQGSTGFRLRAHNPEAQHEFEQLIRAGTKRRAERQVSGKG